MSAAVEIRDLFRVHSTPEGDAAALQGLSLTVQEREVITVLGPSGSGKTSFVRILAGLDRPSAGIVRVFGRDVAKLDGRALSSYRTRTLGYADQHYARALASELTARELVALQLGLRGELRGDRLRRADELLERVGLAGKRDRRPEELSGGEQQRVAVCAALAHRPKLLLADEPTGELDAANAEAVYRLIGDLARDEGCTTVIVSHDPESASIADRIVRIRDGRVAEEWARDGGVSDTIVVGRGGWLRLPEELLARAGIATHATASLEEGRIVVAASGTRAEQPAPLEPSNSLLQAPKGEVVSEVRGLAKAYGANPVFAGLDARFETGRLYAITGPSGSGKTTLLHALAGLELPDAGEIVLAGTPFSGLDRTARAELRRRLVGFVGQQPGLVPFLSARENVELALAVRGAPAAGALETLEAVGLADRAEQRVSRLSAGERERVAIARAVATRPALLLADEPTSRLDQANAVAMAALLARLARETGAAVLCATHDPLVLEQADDELRLG
jgi:ABC-type lipoprotein export system ATPase subunit